MTAERRVRVLIVDDDGDFRLLLRVRLDLDPRLVVVGAAADGMDALDCLEREAVDVVALDLLMPRMNGFEVIERLRGDHPGVGIVAYSAVAGEYARQQTTAFGVELVLKSGDQTALVEALLRVRCRDDGHGGGATRSNRT